MELTIMVTKLVSVYPNVTSINFVAAYPAVTEKYIQLRILQWASYGKMGKLIVLESVIKDLLMEGHGRGRTSLTIERKRISHLMTSKMSTISIA